MIGSIYNQDTGGEWLYKISPLIDQWIILDWEETIYDTTLFLYLEEILDVNILQEMKLYGEIFIIYDFPDFLIIYETIHGASSSD